MTAVDEFAAGLNRLVGKLAIAKRPDAPAQPRAGFQDMGTRALLRQLTRGDEAGKAAADHDDPDATKR